MGDGAVIRRAGRFWYFVDHLVPREGAVVRLWVGLPMNRPGQAVTPGAMTPEPVRVHEDPLTGTRVACFEVPDPPPGEPPVFTLDFEVEATEVHTNVDPGGVAEHDRESAEYLRFTQSEAWIEITDEIAAAAQSAVGEEKNPFPAARLIVAERPKDALAWFHLGQISMNRSEFGEARENFANCIAGEGGSIHPVLAALSLMLRGNCFDLEGRREEAVAEYEAVVRSGIDFQGAADQARRYLETPFTGEDE